MGGDYITATRPSHTWETGRENRDLSVLRPQSTKSVICTSHLSPGCYGQQECRYRALNQLALFLCYSHMSVLILAYTLYCDFLCGVSLFKNCTLAFWQKSQNKALIPCYSTALSTAAYLPHLVFLWLDRLCGLHISTEHVGWVIAKYEIQQVKH